MYSGVMFTFYILPFPPNKTKQDKTKQNKTNNTQPTKKKNPQLTVDFNFTQFIIGILWIVARVCNIRQPLIVVNDIASKNRTNYFLVLYGCALYSMYLMETKMAVILKSCVGNVERKSCHSISIRTRICKKNW